MSNLFKRMILDKNQGNYLFSAIRLNRVRVQAKHLLDNKWNGRLYPSTLTFSMCPVEYFQNIDKAPDFSLDTLYKLRAGTMKHIELQEELVNIPDLLYPKPQIAPEFQQKLNDFWPEVPIFCPESGISGRADAVLNIQGEPVVVDIKTTFLSKDIWLNQFDTRFPSESNKTQVCIYIYLMNKLEYYPVKIKQGGFAYKNLLFEPNDKNSEREVYFEYTDELEDKTGLLIANLIATKVLYLAGQELVCGYSGCKKHNKGRLNG